MPTLKRRLFLEGWLTPALYLVYVLVMCQALTGFYSWDRDFVDAKAYFLAAQKIAASSSLYASYGLADSAEKQFLYPPSFAAVLVPLTVLPPLWMYAVWMSLHLLAVFLMSQKIIDILQPPTAAQVKLMLLFLYLMLALPLRSELTEGQVNLWIVLALLYWLQFQEQGKLKTAGCCLALAIHIKIQAVIIVFGLLLRRQFRAVLYAGIWIFVLGLLPLLVIADHSLSLFTGYYLEYFQKILIPLVSEFSIAGRAEFFVPNASLSGVLHRLFENVLLSPFAQFQDQRGPLLISLPSIFVAVIEKLCFFLSMFLAFWLFKKRSKQTAVQMLQLGLVLVSLQLSSPTFWEHHFLTLVFLFAPLLYLTFSGQISPTYLLSSSFVFLLALTVPALVHELNGDSNAIHLSRLYGGPTLGIVILWLSSGWYVWRVTKKEFA